MTDYTEIIGMLEKHLPKLQIETLTKQLNRLRELEAETISKSNHIDYLQKRIDEFEKLETTKIKLEDMGINLDAREKALQKSLQQLTVDLLQKELDLVKENKNEIFRLVETLVKNPRSIELINGNMPVALASPGGHGFMSSGPFIQTKTTEEQK